MPSLNGREDYEMQLLPQIARFAPSSFWKRTRRKEEEKSEPISEAKRISHKPVIRNAQKSGVYSREIMLEPSIDCCTSHRFIEKIRYLLEMIAVSTDKHQGAEAIAFDDLIPSPTMPQANLIFSA
jgi:hypothetical protein